jgi:hypothetical protein
MAPDLMATGPEGEEVLNRLGQYMLDRGAPSTFMPQLANDPRINLLLQATGRQQQHPHVTGGKRYTQHLSRMPEPVEARAGRR